MVRSGGVTISGLESSKNVIVSYGVDKTGCTIKDCKVQGAIIILGGANPTEFVDEETGEKFLHASDEPTVTLTGDYVDVRVMSPYVSLSANSNNPNVIPAYYGVKYAKISANVVQ